MFVHVPSRRKPSPVWATPILVAASMASFVWLATLGAERVPLLERWGAVPETLFSSTGGALNAALDVIGFPSGEAVASDATQPLLDFAGVVAKARGLAIAQHVTAVEVGDLPLDGVDARIEPAEMAIIVVAIGIALRRIPLGGGRSRGNEGRGCNGGRN